MLTWAERWEHNRLVWKLDRLNRAYSREHAATAEEGRIQLAKYYMHRNRIEYPLWAIETAALRRWAGRLAIDIEAELDEAGAAAGHAFYSTKDRNDLARRIRAVRRDAIEFRSRVGTSWFNVLVAVLSLVVALAAVLRD